MKYKFWNKSEPTMEQMKDEIIKKLCSEAEEERTKRNEERIADINKGLILEGDMYLKKDTGEIRINQKYLIKPSMTVYDIKNNLIDILSDEAINNLANDDPDTLILKTIDDSGFSIKFELCLYDKKLEKVRMNIVSTDLEQLEYTKYYKFDLKLEHTLKYLEKFTQNSYIKRDRIIFEKGILTVFANDRESDVKVLINYN